MARARLRIVTVRDEDILNSEPPDSKAQPAASSSATSVQNAPEKKPKNAKSAAPKSTVLKSTALKSTAPKSTTKTTGAKAAAEGTAQVDAPKVVSTKSATVKRAASASPPVPVVTLMRTEVITCAPGAALSSVGQLMWDHDVGAVVVLDDERKPVSVVTDRDLAMAAYTQGSPLAHIGVGTCMSKRLVTCREETDAASVAQLMREHQVRRVPVVDAEGKLVGIVGLRDLLVAVAKSNSKAAFKAADALATVTAILS